jgi:hypothetical protein
MVVIQQKTEQLQQNRGQCCLFSAQQQIYTTEHISRGLRPTIDNQNQARMATAEPGRGFAEQIRATQHSREN